MGYTVDVHIEDGSIADRSANLISTQSNTPTEFSWCGSLPGVFTGTHKFVFKAAGSNGELTDFFQGEDFSGLLVPLFTYTSMVTSTEEGFKAYNEQLKQRCEQVAARVF